MHQKNIKTICKNYILNFQICLYIFIQQPTQFCGPIIVYGSGESHYYYFVNLVCSTFCKTSILSVTFPADRRQNRPQAQKTFIVSTRVGHTHHKKKTPKTLSLNGTVRQDKFLI